MVLGDVTKICVGVMVRVVGIFVGCGVGRNASVGAKVVELVDIRPDLAGIATAVRSSGLANDIDLYEEATFFAPPTAALQLMVDSFPDLAGALLSGDPNWILHTQLLVQMHLVNGTIAFAEDLVAGTVLTTESGENITVSVVDNVVSIAPAVSASGMANVVVTDGFMTQGMVHDLSAVLKASYFDETVGSVAAVKSPTLADLVVSAGLEAELTDTFGITCT